MPRRIAASLALVVFAVCLVMGLQAGNSFSTVVTKALLAMAGTVVIGLILGAMAQKMLDENLAAQPRAQESQANAAVPEAQGRRSDR